MDNLRINERITARQVRVIGADGKQLGVLDIKTALMLARQQDLDLIEISSPPNAAPVCKLADYNKLLFEQKKKDKEEKRKQRDNSVTKEIQLRPHIEVGDLNTKVRMIKQFMEDRVRVRVKMSFRGRENAHKSVGEAIIDDMLNSVKEVAVVDSKKNDDNSILVVLRPA